jgi:transcriptional regulator with PAS, ATPase and Fis domain
MLAETIHQMSPRHHKPFVKVSCAALPENLLESELFGYQKGAFTDAKSNKAGRVAVAEGGTLFLDEIGEIPLSIQVKLLRFIQEKEYEPLGTSTPHAADVRIVAATHRDLMQRIRDGLFREDLFYRLNIVSVELPSLNERKDDIPAFLQHFIRKFNRRYKKNIEDISDDAMQMLLSYDYPGNIRELENAIEHAFVLCKTSFINPQDLPPRFLTAKDLNNQADIKKIPKFRHLTSTEQHESNLIREMLKQFNGNKLKAAKKLNMHRSTLWRKMQRYNIDLSSFHS